MKKPHGACGTLGPLSDSQDGQVSQANAVPANLMENAVNKFIRVLRALVRLLRHVAAFQNTCVPYGTLALASRTLPWLYVRMPVTTSPRTSVRR